MKGVLVPYITRGQGAGEIQIDLAKLGVPPEKWLHAAAQAARKRQVQTAEVTKEGWLVAKVNTGHLSKSKRQLVVEKIHNELTQRMANLVPQKVEEPST